MILRKRAEVYIPYQGKIFVGVRNGRICLPGGTLDTIDGVEETPLTAAIRECKEEIGVRPKNLKLLSDNLIVKDGWGGYTHCQCWSYIGDFAAYDEKEWGAGPEGRYHRALITMDKLLNYFRKTAKEAEDSWQDVAKHNIQLVKQVMARGK